EADRPRRPEHCISQAKGPRARKREQGVAELWAENDVVPGRKFRDNATAHTIVVRASDQRVESRYGALHSGSAATPGRRPSVHSSGSVPGRTSHHIVTVS